MSQPLILGTRGSDLALWQARWIQGRLGDEAAGIRLEILRTEGDRAFDADLAASESRGLFTRDIEQALLDERIDAAVHSLKDLPTLQPAGLSLAAVPERAAPGDVLLVREEAVAAETRLPLKPGARVGTGSPRRVAMLQALRPDLVTGPFRGNVPTRVAKCVRGEVDAVILARAGLDRLGLDTSPLVTFDLDPSIWLPAPAQGALGLQARENDESVHTRLGPLRDVEAERATNVERALLRILEAGCHAALGAWARPSPAGYRLDAGLQDGRGRWLRVSLLGSAEGLAGEAADLLTKGAADESLREGCWRARIEGG